ncbi:hypothetical protein [Sphingomonas sp.]|jgi:hypothetical protein|uniref:hypothetical protein n=1 Tax=Sphingomonas sp. TaxID=28214 RepID=UPI0026309EC4|nr:hypothetical protein [Sphingomonas sp.]MDF2495068.1 hypothetical protein [Sphingomonas sp.]
MNAQLRLRVKPEPKEGADLPALNPEQREAMRGLPTELVRGIASLFRQRAPLITKPDVWPVIVGDALYLASTGWAVDALALGWHPLELFGCSASARGDDDRLGLAGRLDGRDITQITDTAVLLSNEDRFFLLRRNASWENTIYLWEYGR